ncbi:MAG: hypothetical protein AAB584_01455 [Patescibacteria group bacterium]
MNPDRKELIKKILIGVGLLGLITITGAMAPNIFSALNKNKFIKRKYNNKIGKVIHALKERKLIIIKENPDGSMKVELSKNGKKKILGYDLEKLKIRPMKKWDGKWRFVMFDIPNKFKGRANALREKLKGLGLYQFQKSVWIHPYPLENEVEFILKLFEVKPFVKLGEITEIDGETKLKKKYNLE